MSLTITTNTTANTAIRHLRQNEGAASSSLAKLSSGSRIVKSSDDAAGLAVGTKLKADVTSLRTAQVNASHVESLLQVADGGLARISDILIRMKALASQATSGSVSNNERSFIDLEFQQLKTQIDATAGQTKFNGQPLLNGAAGQNLGAVGANLTAAGVTVGLNGNAEAGSWALGYNATTKVFSLTGPAPDNLAYSVEIDPGTALVHEGTIDFAAAGISLNLNNFNHAAGITTLNTFTVTGTGTLEFQVGVGVTDTIPVNLDDVRTATLGVTGSVGTAADAAVASGQVDVAISEVNAARANTGSLMSRFEFAGANLATQVENLDAARSTIMDVDVADEMTKFSASNVLQQAATAMLAQANQMPQGLLRLLQ